MRNAARWCAVAALLAGVGIASVPAGTAHAATTNARGVLDGDPHTVRIRPVLGPVLGPVPTAPRRRPTTAARSAATAALAVCDPAQLTAVRAASDATAHVDPATACVVAGSHPASRAKDRLLLGPAAFTGNDVNDVAVVKRGRNEFALELTLDQAHTQALDDFGRAQFHGAPVAVTLDGRTVASFVLGRDDTEFTGMHGTIWFEPADGYPHATATTFRAAFDDARHEQLVGLLGAATMTPAARRIVASVSSSVDDKTRFADDCPVQEVPDTVVFGCFGHGTLRVLRVDRPDLAPVMVVSAAHEMLHGAYERLGTKERRNLDAELERVYAGLDDPQLTALVGKYKVSEPGRRDDELHSLMGTQIATLSPMLERHYRRFFHDRQQVVAAFRSYDDVLTTLQHQRDDLQGQLAAMKAQLDDDDARIDAAGARGDDLAGQIEALRAQGRIEESNDLVGAQNDAVHEANALVDEENVLVDQYNALVDRYNALVHDTNEIYDSLSTRSTNMAASAPAS